MSEQGQLKIGEVLVQQGVISADQVAEILEAQQTSGRPFGDLAERMFGVKPEDVEQAWITQYISYDTEIDLESQYIDTEVLKVINRRQAWQFRILPIRQHEESGEIVAATSKEFLRRAVNFAWRQMRDPVYFMVTRRPQLEDFLMKHYPWPGAMDLPVSGDSNSAA